MSPVPFIPELRLQLSVLVAIMEDGFVGDNKTLGIFHEAHWGHFRQHPSYHGSMILHLFYALVFLDIKGLAVVGTVRGHEGV